MIFKKSDLTLEDMDKLYRTACYLDKEDTYDIKIKENEVIITL